MTDEVDVSIKLSRVKMVFVVVGSVLFVMIGTALFEQSGGKDAPFSLFMKLLSLNFIFLFGFCGVYAGGKLFDRKPGLILNSQGIFDNSSAASLGLIPWERVRGLRVVSLSGQKFLVVDLSDPKEFLARAGLWNRWLAWMNWKFYGSPVQISAMTLACGFRTLHETVKQAWDRFGKHS
jgi:hypothetical protein